MSSSSAAGSSELTGVHASSPMSEKTSSGRALGQRGRHSPGELSVKDDVAVAESGDTTVGEGSCALRLPQIRPFWLSLLSGLTVL
mmetsp:Transcript_2668/g.5565  ORF Transcript_2668/g.5565 Transcript_2668/m.5565 type:complete len:85 (+) Transcript_2668:13-267(+)